MRPFTTIKNNEMKPMNLQEEVKKVEEQESAINVACPMEDEASWVVTCKGDHEEEITQFDGETVKKMMINEISTYLSNVDNVKISPEGFDSEATRTVSRAHEIPNALVSRMLLCQFCRFGRKLER